MARAVVADSGEDRGASRKEVEEAMERHIIDTAELMGRYGSERQPAMSR